MSAREATGHRLLLSREAALGWLLMAPALVLLAAMAVGPAIYLVYVSFRHENLLGPGSTFVGLQNFARVLSDAGNWWDALSTLLFVVLSVGVELALGLALALLLSRGLRETNLLTALFILPLGVAPVVSALVFRVLLDPCLRLDRLLSADLGVHRPSRSTGLAIPPRPGSPLSGSMSGNGRRSSR